ncbi:MAG: ATP synthase F0 subunit B [Myxococcota bacterium]
MFGRTLRAAAVALPLLLAVPAMAQHGSPEAEHGQEAEAHGEGHGAVTLGAILSDTKFQAGVIAFLLLVSGLVLVVGPKITAALEKRQAEIREALEEAQRLKAEAEARKAELDERLAKLDAEMDELKSQMVRAGEEERDRIIAEAEEKAALMRKDTQFQIDQRFKQLRQDLYRESVTAAVGAAQELLTKETNADDQTRLAQGYLDSVAKAAKERRA